MVKNFEYKDRNNANKFSTNIQKDFMNKIDNQLVCQLTNGTLVLQNQEIILFQSKPTYYVQNYIFTDMDNDQKPELCLILWKSGSFGTNLVSMLPYDPSIKCHLFLYEWNGREFIPFFQSSNLTKPIVDLDYLVSKNTHLPVLRVYESEYQLININLPFNPNRFTDYSWQYFGLVQTQHK